MGWNEEGKDKDRWSGKNKPPDLDEVLKRLHTKFKKILIKGLGISTHKKGRKNSIKNSFANSGNKTAGFFLMGGAVAIIMLWILAGIFIVDPAEQAVVLRFGRYIETVGPGPHWIPLIVSSKIVQNVERVADYSYSAQMLTKDENLVSVSLAVQYRIADLYDYLFNVSSPEESLRQATSSALRQVVGTTTLDEIITEGREAWGSSVQESLIKILAKYKTGIVIVNVSPQPARAPENVQDAFDDAIKAQEDEKRFKEQAFAYKARVVPIAEGNAKRIFEEARAFAKQVVFRAKGDVAEFLALLPEYEQSPIVTSQRMYIDTIKEVLSKSSKIIIDEKISNLLYLPLDKLANKDMRQVKTQLVSMSDEKMLNKSLNKNGVLDNRETIRPTTRLGGNN